MNAAVEIDIPKISAPKYYLDGEVDAIKKQLFDLLGIRYVCVNSKNVNYHILEQHLAEVVAELKLYNA